VQDAEVLADARGRSPEPAGEVGRRRRQVECREDRRAAAAEQRRERLAVAVGPRRPQRSQAARGVDEGGLPRLVEHREDPRPGEGGGDE
jgi:hypothetical protein